MTKAGDGEVLGEVVLDISGLGIVLYSPFAAAGIAEGDDYLRHFRAGYPDAGALEAAEYKLRLGLEVRDRALCARDLYDLLDWTADCPVGQVLAVESGLYEVTLCSDRPSSGVLGDNQVIHVFLRPVAALPQLSFDGIPALSG